MSEELMPIPYGGRGNTLPAFDWARVYTAPPPAADALLLELYEVGIAAYAIALEDDSPYRVLSATPPLHDTIFVERRERKRAVDLIQLYETESIDSRFNELVGALSLDTPTSLQSFDEREERFMPPTPDLPPIPGPITRFALTGVFGGLFLILLSLFTSWNLDGMGPWIGLVGVTSGGVTLWIRMQDRELEEGDDGAVV